MSPEPALPEAGGAPGVAAPGDGCMSCGSPLAVRWSTPDGAALLCRECATLHGLACP